MKKFYINKNLIFVALLAITLCLSDIIDAKIFNIFENNNKKYKINYYFLTCISKLFLFVPYLINKKYSFKNVNKKLLPKRIISNLFSVKEKNYFENICLKFKICFLIFSCSFLNFLSVNYFYYYKYDFKEYYSIILFILYQIIFEIKFYNFHYVSISILLLLIIIKSILSVFISKIGFIIILNINLIVIILRSLDSINIILIKYLNVLYYIDMYLIFFISEGILYFIYLCIHESLLKENFFKYLDFSSSNLLYYFIFIVINFLQGYFLVIVLFLFNPIYYAFANLIYLSIYNFYELFIKKNSNFYNISIIFISLFDLISVLIYSELIQLKCFNLNKNTMNNMIIRAENEFEINCFSINSQLK